MDAIDYVLIRYPKTAVLRVQNDILKAIDDGNCVFLVLLDLSAAFDTVLHNIVLKRLSSRYRVKGNAIKWIESYLTNRSQTVFVSGRYSEPATLKYGVPQGSVLGATLFTDYSAPVAALIRAHGVSVQRKNRTDQRSTLGDDTLEALLVVKANPTSALEMSKSISEENSPYKRRRALLEDPESGRELELTDWDANMSLMDKLHL
jgi:hypothetical protein